MIRLAENKTVIFLFLVLLGTVIYFNSMGNPFHFDDFHHIVKNPGIRDIRNIPYYFIDLNLFTIDPGNIGNYRPLLLITYALNYWAVELNPFLYHTVNLAFHVGCSMLVFLITDSILRCNSFSLKSPARQDKDAQPSYIALTAGLIFLVHPFNSEVINYISARSSVMSAFFYLLAFYFWIKYRGNKFQTSNFRTQIFYLLSILSYLLGLFTKEAVITLPVMLWLYDFYFASADGDNIRLRLKNQFKNIRSYVPLIIITIIPYMALRTVLIHSFIRPHQHSPRGFYVNLLTETKVLLEYIYLLFLPVKLTVEHYVSVSYSFFEWQVLTSSFLLICLLIAAVWLFYKRDRRWRLVSFFIIWFFIVLIPVTIFPLNAMLQENRAYLNTVTFAVFLGVLLDMVSSAGLLHSLFKVRSDIILSVFLLLILGVYSASTIQRNKVWKDDLSLWSDAVKKSPLAPRAHHNLALSYKELGMLELAISEYKMVLELDPNYKISHYNLGNIYNKLGMLRPALSEYQKVIEIDPAFYHAYNNMGSLYWTMGNTDTAIQLMKEAVRINPQYSIAHNNLGKLYKQLGDLKSSQEEFAKAESAGSVAAAQDKIIDEIQ